jgi:hypothetical protein
LTSRFPLISFNNVDHIYPDKTTPYPYTDPAKSNVLNPYLFTRASVLARGQTALQALQSLPLSEQDVVVVVSHSGFLRTAITELHWMNADYRVFDFEKGQESARITIRARKGYDEGGMGKSWAGRAEIVDTDFPAEETSKVEASGEATQELPEK